MGDQAALDALNQIVHPAVRQRRDELLSEARERGDALVVNDIPLLFEVLDPAQFDVVVLVDAATTVRRTRLRAMRGLSNDEADRMLAVQMPAERKRARSHFVIDNDGSRSELERGTRAVFEELRRRAARAAVRLDLRPWGYERLRLVEPGAAGLKPRPDLFPVANPLP